MIADKVYHPAKTFYPSSFSFFLPSLDELATAIQFVKDH